MELNEEKWSYIGLFPFLKPDQNDTYGPGCSLGHAVTSFVCSDVCSQSSAIVYTCS